MLTGFLTYLYFVPAIPLLVVAMLVMVAQNRRRLTVADGPSGTAPQRLGLFSAVDTLGVQDAAAAPQNYVYTGYKHCCVVDAEGNYKDLVQVHIYTSADGTVEDRPQYYTLQAGEQLVDAAVPTMRPHTGADGLIRLRWDDNAETWTEGATGSEIIAWEAEHPAPEPSGPSAQEDADAIIVDHEYRLTLLELGVK